MPFFIPQGERKAVNLVLRRQRNIRIGGEVQKAPDTRHEIVHILRLKRIVEAHHALGMRDFLQARTVYSRANHFIGAIGAHEMRKSRL